MWQASLSNGSDSIQLVLTQSASGSADPRFVAARQWLSVGQKTIAIQLHRWEQDHGIEIERLLCTREGFRFCPPEWPTTVVSAERVNLLAEFWQTLTLPEWQKGLALALLSLGGENGRNCPEKLALAWLTRRIVEVEFFLYGDERLTRMPSA